MEESSLSGIIAALSYALDLTEGQPMGHSARACVLGLRIGAEIGVLPGPRSDLYYTLLLKNAGCSSNASSLFHLIAADEIRARRDGKTTDWTRVGWDELQYALSHIAVGRPFLERIGTLLRSAAHKQRDVAELTKIRCERGAAAARRLGFGEPVAQGIHYLEERWNGRGHPDGRVRAQIPLLSRIGLLAQTLEVFSRHSTPARAVEIVRERAGSWFDPQLVRSVESLAARSKLWTRLDQPDLLLLVRALEPSPHPLAEERTEAICRTFAEIIDAKSPFTYRHSLGVAEVASAIAGTLGMPASVITLIRRAALLHNLGTLGVPNSILEKPDKLNPLEWDIVRRHPRYTHDVLRRIPGFASISEIAAGHHERLDGSGYFRGLTAARLSLPSRILAVADVYHSLAGERSYREALHTDTAIRIMLSHAPHGLDAQCLSALRSSTVPSAGPAYAWRS